MSLQDPAKGLASVAVCATLIAFASATLDICVDAWRVDSAKNEEQAAMSAVYQLGYRFGMIAAVSGGMFLADIGGFSLTYTMLGILALIGGSTPLWAPEPGTKRNKTIAPKFSFLVKLKLLTFGLLTLFVISIFFYLGMLEGGYLRFIGGFIADTWNFLISPLSPKGRQLLYSGFGVTMFALPFLGVFFFLTIGNKMVQTGHVFQVPIIGDFADIVRRTGWMALVVFGIVATYRISDTTMGVMAMPLYIDLGYSKSVIGTVKGFFGITMLVIGTFIGAWSAIKHGLARAMIIGAILTILTNLTFAWLATVEAPKALYLFATIGADNVAAGFAGSVFIAFMSILTNKAFSASQYALFSSLFAFYGKGLASVSGILADAIDYQWFFIVTSLFGIPALLLVTLTCVTGFTDGIDENGMPQK